MILMAGNTPHLDILPIFTRKHGCAILPKEWLTVSKDRLYQTGHQMLPHLEIVLLKESFFMNRRKFFLLSSMTAASLCGPAFADNGDTITLSGDLRDKDDVVLSDGDLMQLPQVSFETSTIWTNKRQTFSGPTLLSVLERYGAGEGPLELGAINDYTVNVARSLVSPVAPIIANRIDGQPFGRREKGPFWVVFPFDSAAAYQNEQIYSVSIWQLSQIRVLEA